MNDIFELQKESRGLFNELARDIEIAENNRFMEKMNPIISDIFDRRTREENEKEQRQKMQFEIYKEHCR